MKRWGGTSEMRSERFKLVVQLRRFLVLEEAQRPNLASQCFGAELRELIEQWEGKHGYRPLLGESLSDSESHAGIVYKVTNWWQAGMSKGFSQEHTDFYIPNGRPKKLWLKELASHACELMSARAGVAAQAAKRFRFGFQIEGGSPLFPHFSPCG